MGGTLCTYFVHNHISRYVCIYSSAGISELDAGAREYIHVAYVRQDKSGLSELSELSGLSGLSGVLGLSLPAVVSYMYT